MRALLSLFVLFHLSALAVAGRVVREPGVKSGSVDIPSAARDSFDPDEADPAKPASEKSRGTVEMERWLKTGEMEVRGSAKSAPGAWPGDPSTKAKPTESDWKGFTKVRFVFEGKNAFVVVPKEKGAGNPWVWRTSFPDFHSEIDVELLRSGFHLAHVDVVAMLGSDASLEIMDRFYEHVRKGWSLAAKPALEAVSRGGLHAYRYAATRPDRVACIYADTPVMDLKSWPLKHTKSAAALAEALQFYGFADEAALVSYEGDPLDLLGAIAQARIPLRHIISLNDAVVPAEDNTLEAKRRLEALGWAMEVVTVDPTTTSNDGHHFPLIEIGESAAFIRKHAEP